MKIKTFTQGDKFLSSSSGKEIVVMKVEENKITIARHNGWDVVTLDTALYNLKNKI